jgi:hypothetical protein
MKPSNAHLQSSARFAQMTALAGKAIGPPPEPRLWLEAMFFVFSKYGLDVNAGGNNRYIVSKGLYKNHKFAIEFSASHPALEGAKYFVYWMKRKSGRIRLTR